MPDVVTAAATAEADVESARRELAFAEAEAAAQAAAAREAAERQPPAQPQEQQQHVLWSRDQREALESLQRSAEASERAADDAERQAQAAVAAAARWPTPGARQEELQRRLASLAEQLVARQAACATAESEVQRLSQRLRAVHAESADMHAHVHATRRRRQGDGGIKDKGGEGGGGRRPRGLPSALSDVDSALAALAARLRASPGLRTSFALYVMALHVFAFLMLAFRASTTDKSFEVYVTR